MRVGRRRPGVTMAEAVIFGAIGLIFVGIVVGIFARGSKFLELGRKTSDLQTNLRILLENLSEDAAEITHLDRTAGKTFTGSGAFTFYTFSNRAETGLPGSSTKKAGYRKIEYKLGGTAGSQSISRTVTLLAGPQATSGTGTTQTIIPTGVAELKIWSVAAAPQGNKYTLVMATDDPADDGRATVACLLVEVTMGQEKGKTALDKSPNTHVVTKLWCRNRVLELARGALR